MYALKPTTSAKSTLSRRTGKNAMPAPIEIPAATTTPTASHARVQPSRKLCRGAASAESGRGAATGASNAMAAVADEVMISREPPAPSDSRRP